MRSAAMRELLAALINTIIQYYIIHYLTEILFKCYIRFLKISNKQTENILSTTMSISTPLSSIESRKSRFYINIKVSISTTKRWYERKGLLAISII